MARVNLEAIKSKNRPSRRRAESAQKEEVESTHEDVVGEVEEPEVAVRRKTQKEEPRGVFFTTTSDQEKLGSNSTELPIDKIRAFKGQARVRFNEKDLQNLASSIMEIGVSEPIKVILSDDGYYEVISGERRWRAAMLANLKKIPCKIITNEKDAEKIALIENISRENLHPIEMGAGLKRVLDRGIYSDVNDLSSRLGISRSVAFENIKFASMDSEISQLLLKNNIKVRSVLREVSGLEKPHAIKLINDFVLKSVAATEPGLGGKPNKNGYSPRKPAKKKNLVNIIKGNDGINLSLSLSDDLSEMDLIHMQKHLNLVLEEINGRLSNGNTTA
jgi:ParB/RepB/Spo0J family partition protein